MARELHTARLVRKDCLSEADQCYHFLFELEGVESFSFVPGQFVSFLARDESGKEQMRAYSIASAPDGNRFELCVNRVESGFFSNLLPDLPMGACVQVDSPHGYFTLREPFTDSILVATGTGIAPIRAYLQWLFPAGGPDRSEGREIWLVFGARYQTGLYYHREFKALAAHHPNFHYMPTLSREAQSWTGLRGYVQQHVARIVEQRAARLGLPLPQPPPDPAIPARDLRFDVYAYICGLNEMVAGVRELLASYGWHRKQIVFERYD